MSLVSTLLILAPPLAGVTLGVALSVAAVVGEEGGLAVGAPELGGAALALFLIREVFGFIRWNSERKEPKTLAAPGGDEDSKERTELIRELVGCHKQQTEILRAMQRDQAVILDITKAYDRDGRCPLTIAGERQDVIEGIGKAVRSSR